MDYLVVITNNLIGWSNVNTGFLMALLTAVYVLATILIVYESRTNNRLMVMFEKDRVRPHVVFWVESEMQTHGKYFTAIDYIGKIRNEGKSTAHDIRVTTIPKLRARQGIDKEDENAYYTPAFLEETTSILVPNQTIVENIGPTKFLLEDNDDESLKFKIHINFSDVGGEKYSTEYDIDLSRNRNQMYREDSYAQAYFNLVEKVTDAAQSLESINRSLNQPDRSNMYIREDLELNDRQVELMRKIAEAERQLEKEGAIWILREVVGKTCISRTVDNFEIEVETHDIQTLCRSGHLRGQYSNGSLSFYVAPLAKNA
jgi:hypothetical protein